MALWYAILFALDDALMDSFFITRGDAGLANMTKADPYEQKQEHALFRRFFHACSFWYIIYYFMGNNVPIIELDKRLAAIIVVVTILCIEGVRIRYRYLFPGMRPYEATQLGGYAWGAIGVMLTLLLFPLRFAAPALLGISFIDPMIGVGRRFVKGKKERGEDISRFERVILYPCAPGLAYFAIMLSCIFAFSDHSLASSAILACVGVPAGMLAENIDPAKHKFARIVDDDFRMQLAPLVALTVVEFIISTF